MMINWQEKAQRRKNPYAWIYKAPKNDVVKYNNFQQ